MTIVYYISVLKFCVLLKLTIDASKPKKSGVNSYNITQLMHDK